MTVNESITADWFYQVHTTGGGSEAWGADEGTGGGSLPSPCTKRDGHQLADGIGDPVSGVWGDSSKGRSRLTCTVRTAFPIGCWPLEFCNCPRACPSGVKLSTGWVG